MGYYSYLSGEIIIDPPFNWGEIKDSPYSALSKSNSDADVQFRVIETQKETDEGVFYVRVATAIEPSEGDERRMYKLTEDLTLLAKMTKDRSTTGWLMRVGQEQGDIERYSMANGLLTVQRATLRWPDGTNVTGHEL